MRFEEHSELRQILDEQDAYNHRMGRRNQDGMLMKNVHDRFLSFFFFNFFIVFFQYSKIFVNFFICSNFLTVFKVLRISFQTILLSRKTSVFFLSFFVFFFFFFFFFECPTIKTSSCDTSSSRSLVIHLFIFQRSFETTQNMFIAYLKAAPHL